MLDLDELEREWSEATPEEKYHDGSGCGILARLAEVAPELIHEAKAAREMRSVLAECLANTLNIPLAIRAGAVLRKYPEVT